tara:strand:- start:273 stop:1535 length:1263 start_codon:yes stop_codon:yes gene_type:complete
MISSDYNTLKAYYNNKLNKDKGLIKTSNDEPTPIECVEEMIEKIPINFWKNKNIKILDPCCGCGNFFIVVFNILKKFHPIKHILEKMFYFNDINKDRINIVKKIFENNNYKLNITEIDFLEYNNKCKYDLIVANPPYAKFLPSGKRAAKNHNMIGSFIKKSFELLTINGFMIYITPNNWMSKSDRNKLIKVITSKQIVYLNIGTAKKYFKKVGSSFTWYIIENKPFYKDIIIEGKWKKKLYKSSVKSMVRSYIPLYYNQNIQNILNKVIDNNDNKKFNIETSSYLHKYTKKKYIQKTEDDIFKYKLIHTPSQTVWSKIPHKFQDGYKVFISTTSTYKVFIDNCGMTQSIVFIRCTNLEEATLITKILQHPLFIFINNICRWGNFNNIRILQSFPYFTNYDDIYNYFNINNVEKQIILDDC